MHSTISKFKRLMHNLPRNYRRNIIQMHFHRLIKAQQGLLNIVTKFSNLGCYYEVVGNTIIQQLDTACSTTIQQLKDTALNEICSHSNL